MLSEDVSHGIFNGHLISMESACTQVFVVDESLSINLVCICIHM